jgi:hypothetical protein
MLSEPTQTSVTKYSSTDSTTRLQLVNPNSLADLLSEDKDFKSKKPSKLYNVLIFMSPNSTTNTNPSPRKEPLNLQYYVLKTNIKDPSKSTSELDFESLNLEVKLFVESAIYQALVDYRIDTLWNTLLSGSGTSIENYFLSAEQLQELITLIRCRTLQEMDPKAAPVITEAITKSNVNWNSFVNHLIQVYGNTKKLKKIVSGKEATLATHLIILHPENDSIFFYMMLEKVEVATYKCYIFMCTRYKEPSSTDLQQEYALATDFVNHLLTFCKRGEKCVIQ